MLQLLKTRIEAIITEPDPGPGSFLKTLLHGLSLFYTLVMRLREVLYAKGVKKVRTLPCPVISVGNITVGGTGKTPLVMYLARLILDLGLQPVILSRGYRGRAEKTGGMASDGQKILMAPEMAGDEPYMLARMLPGVPVMVGRKRYASGLEAIERLRPDVLLLDDGFQHRKLARDLDLVLMDAATPVGNGYLLPRGPLREPVTALTRAHALILTHGMGSAGSALPRAAPQPPGIPPKPVFQAVRQPWVAAVVPSRHKTSILQEPAGLKGRKVFVFSGIAKNAAFHAMLRDLGCIITDTRSFSDHHAYCKADIQAICRACTGSGADLLVTTQKDHARLTHVTNWPIDLVVMGIRFSFGPQKTAFEAFIRDQLQKLTGNMPIIP